MRELVRTGLGNFVEFCKNPFFLEEHFKHKRKNTGNTKALTHIIFLFHVEIKMI
jgi:hypothetical protein